MPTIPTILIPKGQPSPVGWPFDSFEDYFDPQPTAYPSGLVVGGIGKWVCNTTLTSAQLLALNATAVQLVNAPNLPPKGFGNQLGLVLVPAKLYAEYIFGGTAYVIGNADNKFQVEYTGKAVSLISALATGLMDQAASTLSAPNMPAIAGVLTALTNACNLGLEIKLTGTTPALTVGNGTLNIQLEYDILVVQ